MDLRIVWKAPFAVEDSAASPAGLWKRGMEKGISPIFTFCASAVVRVREEYLLEKGRHPLHLDLEVSRGEFENLIRDLLDGTLAAFDQALSDAGLHKGDLDKVVFVGGSTRIPLVWELVANHVGLEPMVEINPDEAVALGAAVQAALIAGEPLDAILVDVTPHSLGIEVARWEFGRFVPDHYGIVVRRNTTLPARRAQVFSALAYYHDHKPEVDEVREQNSYERWKQEQHAHALA